ncbi:MAG: CDP-glycerol--glycerophosphate glycerophosphotransferase [Acidimicrobiales bacterium]|nr:CDP-glycerol--glycerophosphate glycerophosphotransferase [Acidimicrobiales bacterium]
MSAKALKAAAKAFKKLPAEWRRLVVYAENRSDWAHLGPVVDRLLDQHDVNITYLTSEATDPQLERDHPRLRAFDIGDGAVRAVAFRDMQAGLLLTTTPDLGTYDVKRSIHPVHYVYLFHAFVSTHMVYRPGAFDQFDTVLCVGPHHAAEIRASEAHYGTPRKRLVKHGYGRLDLLRAEAATATPVERRVVLAGTWGPNAMMERTEGAAIARALLQAGYEVIVRLHPMTTRHHPGLAGDLQAELSEFGQLRVETDMRDRESVTTAALMVSDWSGAAFDYSLGLERPVLFVDVPTKVNNPGYTDLGIEPIEVRLRHELGEVIAPEQLGGVVGSVERLTADPGAFAEKAAAVRDESVYNVGRSAEAAAAWLVAAYASVSERN